MNAGVARLEAEPPSLRHGREHNRRHVSRAQLAEAIARYYGVPPSGSMLYRAKVGDRRLTTSILTRREWLDTAVPLGGDAESARFVPPGPDKRPELTSAGLAAAVQRLAGVEVNGTVMVNNPLYQLLDVDVAPGELSATFTTVEFADHALTTELIEGELIAAIGQSRDELPCVMPTSRRSRRPSSSGSGRASAVWSSLLAIARRRGDVRDYVLFTQERSSTVLNLAGKLATIPKGFHQPTGEPTHEVRPSATVRREFEEELLGRQELEQIEPLPHSHVDLLHDQHLTEPMVWLLDRPDSFRVECTGFGFNLVTGNYEFAGLVVIDDEGWWERFGHLVESNWEAERVNRHSTLDTDGLEALVGTHDGATRACSACCRGSGG